LNKIFLSIISFLFILFLSLNVYAYTDYALTDIILPNTVRTGEDINANFIITSNAGGTVDMEVIVYNPMAQIIYQGTFNSLNPGNNFQTLPVSNDLLYSTQPYLLRGFLDDDDNPTNNHFSKYFTVIKSSDKVPVSDIPLFSGIIIALLFVFVLSVRNNKKNKK
jgi:hypothetical protein